MLNLAVGQSLRSRVLAGVVLSSMTSFAFAAAPVISGKPATTVKVGSWYNFGPTASDADGNSLKFTIVNKPTWISFDQMTGRIVGKPTTVGKWSNIAISVTDGTTKVTLAPFSITTYAPNSAPTISGAPATTVSTGVAYNFQPTASDANGDALGFTITNKPSWASFSTSTGRLSGTPTAVGTFSSIVISVSDGKVSTSLPAFAIAVSQGNRAPTISGAPATAVGVNSAYSFRPTAADADGDTLSYTIANKPSWASFSTTTGQLSGTPTSAYVGSYSNISISVSDGKTSTSRPAFAIAVNAVSAGGAALSWTPPTQNTDGTALTDLAGYRIYFGKSADTLTQMIQVNAGLASYVVDDLDPGTYYFAVRAYTSSGSESANSNVATKVVQ